MKSRCKVPAEKIAPKPHQAFTLVELLVVLVILALLAVTLLPSLAGSRPNNQAAQCMNNLRVLSRGWLMYTADNGDNIPSLFGPKPVAGLMDWSSSSDNTNSALFTNPVSSSLANYVTGPASVYKCPADNFQSTANLGPRVRSYSIDALLGGSTKNAVNTLPGRIYFSVHKLTDFGSTGPGPASVFMWLDEHPDSINDSIFFENAGMSPGTEKWEDLPASNHNGGVDISFIDGHSEIHKWQNTGGHTIYPVTYSIWASSPQRGIVIGSSADYEYLDDRMPYK